MNKIRRRASKKVVNFARKSQNRNSEETDIDMGEIAKTTSPTWPHDLNFSRNISN